MTLTLSAPLMRDKLSLAKRDAYGYPLQSFQLFGHSPFFNGLVCLKLTLFVKADETLRKLALRGLIIFGRKLGLCVQVQDIGLNCR